MPAAASDLRRACGRRSSTVSALLFLEAAALVGIVVWLIVDLIALQPSSYATAIALIVLVVIGAVWVGAVAVASLRRAPWSRAAAIVWQVLQLSVAVGAFQGLFARADVGWLLLVPAITVIGLLLWTPVRLAYTRPGDVRSGARTAPRLRPRLPFSRRGRGRGGRAPRGPWPSRCTGALDAAVLADHEGRPDRPRRPSCRRASSRPTRRTACCTARSGVGQQRVVQPVALGEAA